MLHSRGRGPCRCCLGGRQLAYPPVRDPRAPGQGTGRSRSTAAVGRGGAGRLGPQSIGGPDSAHWKSAAAVAAAGEAAPRRRGFGSGEARKASHLPVRWRLGPPGVTWPWAAARSQPPPAGPRPRKPPRPGTTRPVVVGPGQWSPPTTATEPVRRPWPFPLVEGALPQDSLYPPAGRGAAGHDAPDQRRGLRRRAPFRSGRNEATPATVWPTRI